MRWIRRELEAELRGAARSFPALVVTGPRRAGKTACLRRTFPRASYHLLEDPDVRARAGADPRGFLEEARTPAILDEIQNVPALLPYVRTRIDSDPRRHGRWFLTGSQDFSLMAGVTESMAGRAAVFHLPPLSFREAGTWDLLRGGFPEVVLEPSRSRAWFRSYVQTYLERDVRAVTAVKDLGTFRRFLGLAAARNGQIRNKSDLAAPLGVSVPTITQWLNVLETSGLVQIVPPYFENFAKRIVKSPKLYWTDTGLLSFLLGFESLAALEGSAFIGGVFEAFLASEIGKNQANEGRTREIYFFRDHQGLEVDFVVPGRDGGLGFVETKWSRTVGPDAARGIAALLPRVKGRRARGIVVHRGTPGTTPATALAPGVKALTVETFLRGG
ncbi:MAG: ATP-binding protein [Planctomycetes bacterium]|nr:ATP-binding protein [Planctomycetota bacterium]